MLLNETAVVLTFLRLLLSLSAAPEPTVSLEGYCQQTVSRGFLHCGCTAAFLEEEFAPAEARLVLDLFGVSYAKHRIDEPLATKLYSMHSVERINRVANQLFRVRLELANACPLNFEVAD